MLFVGSFRRGKGSETQLCKIVFARQADAGDEQFLDAFPKTDFHIPQDLHSMGSGSGSWAVQSYDEMHDLPLTSRNTPEEKLPSCSARTK